MIYVRAVHFAATITVAGVAFFVAFIAEPATRIGGENCRVAAPIRGALAWLAWCGLGLTVLSGAAWFVLVAQAMSDRPLDEVFSNGLPWIVLTQTNFGQDWLLRLVLSGLLAAAFIRFLSARRRPAVLDVAVVVLAAALVGTLAWAGHGAGGLGTEAVIHPAADFLHLVAAATWVGMLVPLALLLSAVGRDPTAFAFARTATVRFSNLGVFSVATLLVTGSVNTWYLAGSIPALVDTDYGHLLLAKVALFFVMVAIAAVNRLRFTPRLALDARLTISRDALRQLRRNTVIETVIGAVIIIIVAVLGTLAPGLHQHMM